jgi:hypothetical protein
LGAATLLALGLVYWASSGTFYMAPADAVVTADTTTNTNTGGAAGSGSTGGTGTGTASGTGASGSAGTGSTAPTRNVSLTITGFGASNPTVMPILKYTLVGHVAGDMISIVGKQGGEVVYINEQSAAPGSSYSLNLAELTRGDGTKTAVGAGEYFLRISEKSGKILTQSGFFTVRAGYGETQ